MDEKRDPFAPTGLSFDEYRNQDVIVVDDGAFFDTLDEMFGIEPGTDRLAQGEPEAEKSGPDKD